MLKAEGSELARDNSHFSSVVSIVKDVVEKPKKYNHDIFGSLFSVL
jgi:hypothetical protein